MLSLSDERASDIWHKHATIGREAGGFADRTARSWTAELVKAGWLARQHRFTVRNGQNRPTSNMWRFLIPEHHEMELLALEDAKRRRTMQARQPRGLRRSDTTEPRPGTGGLAKPIEDALDLLDESDAVVARARAPRFVIPPEAKAAAVKGLAEARAMHRPKRMPP